ncbi:hypothetical protein Ddep01_01177 [Deinococcus depolymerans]
MTNFSCLCYRLRSQFSIFVTERLPLPLCDGATSQDIHSGLTGANVLLMQLSNSENICPEFSRDSRCPALNRMTGMNFQKNIRRKDRLKVFQTSPHFTAVIFNEVRSFIQSVKNLCGANYPLFVILIKPRIK